MYIALFFGGITKNQMYWWESLILLCMYLLYVFIMTQNAKLKAFVYRKFSIDEDKQKLLKNQSNGYGTEREISMQKPASWKKTVSYSAESPRPDTIEEMDDFCDGDGGLNQTKFMPNRLTNDGNNDIEEVKDGSDDDDADDGDNSDDESEEGLDMTFPDTTGG